MTSAKLIKLAAVLALACAPMVQAKMNGFGQETTCTQGSSGKPCHNTNNSGTTTTTTTGPKGQLKNDKDHNTTTTGPCGPGNGANACG